MFGKRCASKQVSSDRVFVRANVETPRVSIDADPISYRSLPDHTKRKVSEFYGVNPRNSACLVHAAIFVCVTNHFIVQKIIQRELRAWSLPRHVSQDIRFAAWRGFL